MDNPNSLIQTSSSNPPNTYFFKYYKVITIYHTKVSGTGNHKDFPILISIFDSDLHDDVQSTGNDIAFANDTAWLDHEIEFFDQTFNTTHAQLIAWVRIPSLSTSMDTIIRMYYGNSTMSPQENPEGVWDDNYIMVQHLHETSGTHYDSSINENDGTAIGGLDQDIVGKVDGADDFDGTDAHITVGDSSSLNITDAITIEAWIEDDVEERRRIVTKGSEIYVLRTDYSGILHGYLKSGSSLYHVRGPNNLITTGTYHHVVLSWDGVSGDHNLRLFHNGFEVSSYQTQDSVSSPLDTSDDSLYIGSHGTGEWWDGSIDEVRISDISRSDDWIATEYNNQYDPSSFYSIGIEDIVNPPYVHYFTYYKEITINHTMVSGDLFNFPILISIFDSDLHDHVQPNGNDIAFNCNSTWLDYEIELFNQNYNTTHAQFIAWVRIPYLISSTDMVIRMYYGNSTMAPQQNPLGVWESNFKGVWHLSEDPSSSSPQMKDSTSNKNHGTVNNLDSNNQVNGQIDGSIDFEGGTVVQDYINCTDDSSLNVGSGEFSLSLWFNYDGVENGFLAGKGAYIGGIRYSIWTTTLDRLRGEIDDNTVNKYIETSTPMDDNTWHHVVLVRDEDYLRLYIDGDEYALFPIPSYGSLDNTQPFYINALTNSPGGSPSTFSSAKLDEVRVSNSARSADWINTEYNNQYDPNSFYSIGKEYTVSDHPPNAHYFAYYKELIIDHTKVSGPDDLLNFPILISISDSDLHDDVQSTGNDIAFANDIAWLDYEIELFNQSYSSTHAQLIAWVRIPKLATSKDTIIRMYYGNSTIEAQENPEGVWDDNYKGIWHLSEDPTGTVYDSTSNDNNGSSYGSMDSGDQILGKIDGSIDFDGNDDNIGTEENNLLAGCSSLTISAWIKPLSTQLDFCGIIEYDNTTDGSSFDAGMELRSTGVPRVNVWTTSGFEYVDSSVVLPTTQFTYFVFVYDGDLNIYLDGSFDISTPHSGTVRDNRRYINIGRNTHDGRSFNGTIDEVRISNIARSAGWINTEYNNQYDPNSFFSIGKEYTVSGIPPDEDYFKFYKEVTINHSLISGSHDLYNFPLLISIFDEDLPNKTQMNGDDIAFAYNGAWLDYEIEVFNQSYNGTHAQFVTWVLIPRLSTLENTIIRMYYGNSTMGSRENPEGVWNSDYNGVWHLKENPTDPAPQFFDSTLNNNDGTADNLTSDNQKPGIIDGSLSIEDNSDINERHINISHSISLQLSTDIMVSSWVKTPTGHNTNTADIILAKWGGIPGSQNYWLGKFSNTEIAYYVNNQTEFVSADLSLINDGYWHHIVGLADANNNSINIYIDGIKVNSSYYSGTSTLGNTDLHIGNSPVVEDQEWIGCIDEVRISNVVHSSDWISTEYNNQYNPQSFLIIGPENNLDIEPPTYTNLTESSDPLELGETEIIIINVSDPSGIHQVKIEFESTNHSMTNIGGDTWQYDSWTPSSVGNYSYTIWMEDNCNNWNFTIGSIEVIDTTPPTYSDLIESADPLQLGQNETITIKVYDSPGSGVNQVLLEYDSFNHTMSLISGKWSWSKWKPNSTGIYPYKIYMEDIENNWNETSGTITVISANAPTIENLTESENPLELGNIITINVDVFDEETNVSTVFIELEGYNYTMTNISGNTYEYNWTRSYVGMVFYTIYANDSDNNWNSFSSSFDIVDTTPPVIENLTVSEAPLELGNIVIITVNSTDLSNINQVWIEFEGTNHSMTNLSGNAWQYTSWSPSSTGNYSYTIWAEDNNNNWGFINSSILVQDNTPPLYSDLTEPPGPVELGNPLVISINATDLADIKEVLIEYEYSNHTMINIGGDIWQYTSWMPGSIGNYTYRIYITDNNDNLNYTSSSILFQDTVLPTYFNLYESADPLELGDNPIFRIDINDFAGINQTLIELEGTNHSMENIYGDRWEFNSWTPDNWIVYQYKIYMQDNSGNWNSLIGNITVQDTIAPPSPVLTVVPSGDVSGILTFDWTEGYDPSGILYFILIIDNETDNVYTFNITNTGPDSSYCELPDILPLGRYYYFLAQIDGTGHQSGYTMGSFTVVSFGNGAPDDNSFVIIIIIILVSIIGSITAMVIVRKKLKKDIIPPREKISFKIISSHIRKLSREELTLQGEEIISKTPGDIQDQTLPIKEVTTEEELERYVNEIRENGEQLFIEGAYLEAQEQFKLGRDFFLRLGREEEAQLFSELITGIDGLIEEREKRIKKLEEVKVQGDSVQIYENFYDIIEISKKLRDIDTVNFYQSELVDYFQHNKLKILNLEIYRYDLNEKAELFVSENKYEIAAQLYGKCEEISQLLVQLHKDGEVVNIEKFRNKKNECLK